MYSFLNDYSEGAHPRILKAMIEANLVQTVGYGEDEYSKEATKLIKEAVGSDNVDVHFVVGGTQANILVLSTALRPWEAVISTHEGHIFTHEAGSIEACGHKVISKYSEDGKLTPQLIEEVLIEHNDPMMVVPRVVYISNSTELGTIYTKQELHELKECCQKNNLLFFLDGARLASALTSEINDVNIKDLVNIFDAFYIGATKNGALYGEAIVLVNDILKPGFRQNMKQKGTQVSKGRFLAIQFIELFKDDLYFKLGLHANEMAALLKRGFKDNNYKFISESYTNQQFVVIPNYHIQILENHFGFAIWKPYDENSSLVRFVCSWATKKENVYDLIIELEDINK